MPDDFEGWSELSDEAKQLRLLTALGVHLKRLETRKTSGEGDGKPLSKKHFKRGTPDPWLECNIEAFEASRGMTCEKKPKSWVRAGPGTWHVCDEHYEMLPDGE